MSSDELFSDEFESDSLPSKTPRNCYGGNKSRDQASTSRDQARTRTHSSGVNKEDSRVASRKKSRDQASTSRVDKEDSRVASRKKSSSGNHVDVSTPRHPREKYGDVTTPHSVPDPTNPIQNRQLFTAAGSVESECAAQISGMNSELKKDIKEGSNSVSSNRSAVRIPLIIRSEVRKVYRARDMVDDEENDFDGFSFKEGCLSKPSLTRRYVSKSP